MAEPEPTPNTTLVAVYEQLGMANDYCKWLDYASAMQYGHGDHNTRMIVENQAAILRALAYLIERLEAADAK